MRNRLIRLGSPDITSRICSAYNDRFVGSQLVWTCDNFLCESSSTPADDYTSYVTLFGCPGPRVMCAIRVSLLTPALA